MPDGYLIVGLGNPGPKYAQTYHNVGFLVLDQLAKRWKCNAWVRKFESEWAQCQPLNGSVFLQKPQTYMNLSGEAVQQATHFYKLAAESQVLVISDDLDLPLGRMRIRKNGGPGGHNGLKSIIELLGTDQFPRVRVGIGRGEGADSASDHVLSKIPAGDFEAFSKIIQKAADAVQTILKDGIESAMNNYNQKENHEP